MFLIFCSLLVFIESKYTIFRFPWSLEISFMVMLFYWIANVFKKEIVSFVEGINYKYIFLLPFILFIHLNFINHTNISTNHYWEYHLFILWAVLWFLFVLIISKLIWKNRFLWFIWKNSIIILWFEWIKEFVLHVRLIFPSWFIEQGTYFYWFFQFSLTIVFLIPVIIIVNKYFPLILWSWYKK